MKLQFVLFLSCVFAAGQAMTLERLPAETTKRVFGTSKYSLWTVTVSSNAPTVRAQDVIAATPINELPSGLAADVLRREAARNGLTLAGRAWDEGSPLVSQGLSGIGWATGSKEAMYASWAITFVGLMRALLRGSKPNPEPFVPDLLPDVLACSAGSCGVYIVVAGPEAGKPDRIQVSAADSLDRQAARFDGTPAAVQALLQAARELAASNRPEISATSTH